MQEMNMEARNEFEIHGNDRPLKRRKSDEPTIVSLPIRPNKRYLYSESFASYAINKPFQCFVLPDFFDEETVCGLRQSLDEFGFPLERLNDLHEFYQTPDLKTVQHGPLNSLTQFFSSKEFIDIIQRATSLSDLVIGQVDVSGQRYDAGGYLACHDDDVKEEKGVGRRVAFILYLVDDDWNVGLNGGSLDLYSRYVCLNLCKINLCLGMTLADRIE